MPTEHVSAQKNGLPGKAEDAPISSFPRSKDIRIPCLFQCGLMIAWVKLLLRFQGFTGTKEWIRQHVVGIPVSEGIDPKCVRRTEYAVAMAGALFPGRALCLEQSLVLYYLLRKRGADVKYCQGVQPYPLLAHAWIEYSGEVINDVAERPRLFARLPDQLP